MRLFIAFEVPGQIKVALVHAQEQLRRANAPATWVAPSAMHLTVQFLGDTDPTQLPQVVAAIGDAVAQLAPERYALRLDGVGAFPNQHRPRVVWAGVGNATAALEQLHRALGATLGALGFPRDEHPFQPHLTLGRVQRAATLDQQARLGAALRTIDPLPALTWDVEQLVLFESELRPSGSVYTERHVVTLNVT